MKGVAGVLTHDAESSRHLDRPAGAAVVAVSGSTDVRSARKQRSSCHYGATTTNLQYATLNSVALVSTVRATAACRRR
jgi:hypothetical protein